MVLLALVLRRFEAIDDSEVRIWFVVMSDESFISRSVKAKGHFGSTCDWYVKTKPTHVG